MSKQTIPNQVRRANSTRLVLDSAARLFVRQGFERTSMSDIAAEAGLTKGAVYFYFADKLALLDALLERTELELLEPIFRAMDTSTSSTMSVMKLVSGFARAGGDQPEHALLHLLMSVEMHERGSPVTENLRRYRERLTSKLAGTIANGQRNGEFSSDLPADYLATALLSLIDGLLLEWRRRGTELDGRQLARTARNVVLSGIAV